MRVDGESSELVVANSPSPYKTNQKSTRCKVADRRDGRARVPAAGFSIRCRCSFDCDYTLDGDGREMHHSPRRLCIVVLCRRSNRAGEVLRLHRRHKPQEHKHKQNHKQNHSMHSRLTLFASAFLSCFRGGARGRNHLHLLSEFQRPKLLFSCSCILLAVILLIMTSISTPFV